MRQPVDTRLPAVIRIYLVGFTVLWVGALVWGGISSPSDVPFIVFMMVFGVALTITLGRERLIANQSGVLVRNSFRTYRFEWGEVEGFRLGSPPVMRFGQAIYVLLRNGEVVRADVTTAHPDFMRRAKREQWLKGLREWLPSQD